MAGILNVEVDKFKNTTTTTGPKKTFHFDGLEQVLGETHLTLRHLSLDNGKDYLMLDLNYEGDRWFFFRRGELIINLNNSINIPLKAHESYSNTIGGGRVEESVFYDISKKDLEAICEADSIDMKLSGADSYVTIDKDGKHNFQNYCRIFYNAFYEKKYPESEYKGCMSSVFGLIIILATAVGVSVCL